MLQERQIMVPRKVHVVVCDICGSDMYRSDAGAKEYIDITHYNPADVVDPGTMTLRFNICPKCFNEKIKPMLISKGE